jgi:glycosyltransferase involved in cell wall biosynthesis
MRIAFVNQPFDGVLPPHQNSIGHWTYEVARRLATAHEVMVYSGSRFDTNESKESDNAVRYIYISRWLDALLHKALQPFSRLHDIRHPLFASFLYYFGYILQVAWNLKIQRCDVAHVFNFSQFVPMIRIFNPRLKIVLHMQCEWLTQLDRPLIEKRLRQVDLILGCSEHITDGIRQRFPQFAGRCRTIYNGVDVDYFVKENGNGALRSNGQRRVLFVGRVSPEKGVHVLLEAFEKALLHCPEAQLDIVGPQGQLPWEYIGALSDDKNISSLAAFYNGNSRHGYASILKERLTPNLAKRVTFCQHIPHRRLLDYYRNAEVLINPSFSEAFGMSLIEAMSCEVPVVATRVGGMAEIVNDGRAGLLVESGDASALAEAMLSLLGNEKLMQALGMAGRARVEALFSWEHIVNKLSALYEEIHADS